MLDTLSSLSNSSRALSFAESWFSVTPERLAEYIAEVYAWTTVPIVPVVLFFFFFFFCFHASSSSGGFVALPV
jgi:hypothetical protein